MNLGLLECDHVAPKFRHIAGDYRDMFGSLFERYALTVSLKSYDVCNGELPSSIDACDAYITTGSKYSVYDDLDWIGSLKGFVRNVSDAGKPFVGICFGHQLLAEALGGKVEKSNRGWGVGARKTNILQREHWMAPYRADCRLHYMHQDQVKRLPDNARILGVSEHCPIASFQIGETLLGIQAHPEFIAAYSNALLLDRIERIGSERTRDALETLSERTDEDMVAGWIASFISRGKGFEI